MPHVCIAGILHVFLLYSDSVLCIRTLIRDDESSGRFAKDFPILCIPWLWYSHTLSTLNKGLPLIATTLWHHQCMHLYSIGVKTFTIRNDLRFA